MWLTVTIPAPQTEPITLEEAKRQCNILHDDADEYLTHLVKVARAHVESYCGALFAVREAEFEASEWADLVRLPAVPVTDIPSIEYIDPAGGVQTIDDTTYEVRCGGVWLKPGNRWPQIQLGSRITVTASVGDDCPAPVKHAMLLMISDMNERREPEPSVDPTTFDHLLVNYRYY